MPKAKSFSEADEEERTTIESQWEEEASTTIEQGELAEKIAAISPEPPRRPVTGITSTGANALDEPTVDDQHANPAIAFPLPASSAARLAITQGNDLGRELELFPDKTYTIGRGLDNDVVLTDIAVSRKHFDVRFEGGVWVIVDRGSGNGTLVNGNIEDNPFMLANGDMIEIGNTTLRFDQQGPPRRAQSAGSDLFEEPSTVAGKPPLRTEPAQLIEAPLELPPEPRPPPRERGRTLPPPAPLRARSPSVAPPAPMPPAPMPPAPMPPAPLPQPAALPPLGAAPAPMQPLAYRATSVADAVQPMALGMPSARPAMMPQLAPAMLADPPRPGSGPATALPGMNGHRPMYNGYPQAADLPPQSLHAQLLVMSQNGRADHSTAHVSPLHYGAPTLAPMRPRPGVSLRTKILLGAAGLAVLAAIVTIAVAGGSKAPATSARAGSARGSASVTPIEHATPVVAPVQTPVAAPVASAPQAHAPDAHHGPEGHVATDSHAAHGSAAHDDGSRHVAQTAHDDGSRHTATRRPTRHPQTTTRHVAVAAADTSDAEQRAKGLYQDQKFDEAASVLEAAARSTDSRDARRLRHDAQLFALVGRALATPSNPANTAYEKLRAAVDYDHNVGGGLSGDIRTKLGQIAPKAAFLYFGLHQYDKAHAAIRTAEGLGIADSSVKLVKQQLEAKAGEIYGIASKELGSAPDDAKSKLQLIENMVDASSPWYAKADQLLKSSG